MAVTPEKSAPYAPYSAILEVIKRYRDRGLQTPINSDVLGRIGISDSLINRTLQALQNLDLIDPEGKPTDTLEGLRLAKQPEYTQRLEEWLRSAYADIFQYVDPKDDDLTAIRDAFRSYEPRGQQPRMVSLFTGLCVAAGLMPEAKEKNSPEPPSSSQKKKRRSAHVQQQPPRRRAQHDTGYSSNMSGIPPALAGLLNSLPSPDEGWTSETRDRFLTTFESVLDFCIPIREENNDSDDLK